MSISSTTSAQNPGTEFDPDTLAELEAELTGRLLTPASPDFAGLATPWNAATSAPLAVVQVANATDVSSAIRFASRYGLDVAVQATGHGATYYDRPTLLVQTGLLAELVIDPQGTARVGAGVQWAQVLDAAALYGLAGIAGSAPGVGVVGYLTGGGLSPVGRTFGYSSDYVTAFDVVTGAGELRRATPTENPELFWGLRGGKGALGIVTAVEFELVPVAQIFGGALYFDGAQAAAVAHAWRTWCATLPEAATTSLALMRLPDLPVIPPPLAGRLSVAVRFAWVGDADEGARAIAALQQSLPAEATVILGGTGVMPFSALGTIHADPVDPTPTHEGGMLLRELPAEALDRLLDLVGTDSDCPQLIVELRLLGGAFGRAARYPSAVSHRGAAYALVTIGLAIPPTIAAVTAHADRVQAALEAWDSGGQPNFGATADPARIGRNYDAETLARLKTLATTYDPVGLLTAGQPIRAAGEQRT
jgi:hypothetical protein